MKAPQAFVQTPIANPVQPDHDRSAFRESREVGRGNLKTKGLGSQHCCGRVACAHVQGFGLKAYAPVPLVRFPTSGFGRRSERYIGAARG